MEDKLGQLYSGLLSNPSNPSTYSRIQHHTKRCHQFLNFHQNYWKRKAKIKHFNSMDHNNRYFQSVSKIKAYKQNILQFTTMNNEVIHSQDEITEAITKEFSLRFTKANTTPMTDLDLYCNPSVLQRITILHLLKHLPCQNSKKLSSHNLKTKLLGLMASQSTFIKLIGTLLKNLSLKQSRLSFILGN